MPLTLQEISAATKYDTAAIRYIERQALRKMRERLSAEAREGFDDMLSHYR